MFSFHLGITYFHLGNGPGRGNYSAAAVTTCDGNFRLLQIITGRHAALPLRLHLSIPQDVNPIGRIEAFGPRRALRLRPEADKERDVVPYRRLAEEATNNGGTKGQQQH